jgi:hypothetical protein
VGQQADIQFMGMNDGYRQILLRNSLAKRKSLWFRASAFSKEDTEKCMVGSRERREADDWKQILYYQVNYLIIVLLGDKSRHISD